MNEENMKLTELTMEDLDDIMSKEEKLGYPEDLKEGQELNIPISLDDRGIPVYYGALDFSGKSNELSNEDWKAFVKEITGFEPIDKLVVKKTNKKDAMYIFAMADKSIGACNVITPFNNIFDLVTEVLSWNMIDDEEIVESLEEALNNKDTDELLEICEDYFQHSFFTGLIWGSFEYVSGRKPDKQGYPMH